MNVLEHTRNERNPCLKQKKLTDFYINNNVPSFLIIYLPQNLEGKVVIEDDSDTCFVTSKATEKSFIAPFSGPSLKGAFSTMNLFQHVNRKLFFLNH